MKKQKICIIGGSLTGLVAAISLAKLDCNIDLITGDISKSVKSKRTIAISENNLKFLKDLNISNLLTKEAFPSSTMKLYANIKNDGFLKIFELKNEKKDKKILFMIENIKLIKFMIKKIKKIKNITLKKNEKIHKISNSGLLKEVRFKNKNSKYNLVILCTGYNSHIVKNIFNDQVIKNSYCESAITTIINHDSLNNNTARQIFLDKEILALLPISNNKTSIVWTVNKSIYKKDDNFLKSKIKSYGQNFLKNIKFTSSIERNDLNLLIRKKYFKERTLLLGDALHKVHPLTGQGFNMTLRDLASLENILRKKIELGLDLGNHDVLLEFSKEIKPRNLLYMLGIDFIKSFFSINEENFKNLRNKLLKNLNKNNTTNEIFLNLADKGFEF